MVTWRRVERTGLPVGVGTERASRPPEPPVDDDDILAIARRTIRIESAGVARVEHRLGPAFVEAVRRILSSPGRVIVTGVGKSGLVARKIASTLAGTGTPALFLHPTEAAHGDVGVVVRGDVLLVVSKSGRTGEVSTLLPAVREIGAPVIAIVGTPDSALARLADIVLDASVEEEACPYDLAPTTSTTAAIALGDAIAMALLHARGLDVHDFARLHPGGTLGRRLLWTVRDVMLTEGEVPRVGPESDLSEAMARIAHQRGTVCVIDGAGCLLGVVTAGDLTRFAATTRDFLSRPSTEAMNPHPRTAAPDERAAAALTRMETYGIMAMPVLDDDRVVGMVHLHDLLRSGVRE